jgi:hypothetical protein
VSNKLDEIAHEAFPESDNAEGRCLAALQQAYDLGRAEAEAELDDERLAEVVRLRDENSILREALASARASLSKKYLNTRVDRVRAALRGEGEK